MPETERRRGSLALAHLRTRDKVITVVLVIFILLSLLLHALTIGALIRIRGVVGRQLDTSLEQLSELRQQNVRYNLPVNQTLPIDTTITISETIIVPLSLTVPVSETIVVPIDTPLGAINFDVPLDMSIPVTDTIRVPINKEIPVQTEIPIDMNFPITLDLSEPPVEAILRELEEQLRFLRESL